jgi:hypothetical protein
LWSVAARPTGRITKNSMTLKQPSQTTVIVSVNIQQFSIIAIEFNDHIQDTSGDTDTAFLKERSAKFDVQVLEVVDEG